MRKKKHDREQHKYHMYTECMHICRILKTYRFSRMLSRRIPVLSRVHKVVKISLRLCPQAFACVRRLPLSVSECRASLAVEMVTTCGSVVTFGLGFGVCTTRSVNSHTDRGGLVPKRTSSLPSAALSSRSDLRKREKTRGDEWRGEGRGERGE